MVLPITMTMTPNKSTAVKRRPRWPARLRFASLWRDRSDGSGQFVCDRCSWSAFPLRQAQDGLVAVPRVGRWAWDVLMRMLLLSLAMSAAASAAYAADVSKNPSLSLADERLFLAYVEGGTNSDVLLNEYIRKDESLENWKVLFAVRYVRSAKGVDEVVGRWKAGGFRQSTDIADPSAGRKDAQQTRLTEPERAQVHDNKLQDRSCSYDGERAALVAGSATESSAIRLFTRCQNPGDGE